MIDLPRFHGGQRLMKGALTVGIAGLLLTLLGAIFRPRQAAYSYLTAYVFWAGIAVAGMGLLMTFHVAHARWPVVVRRLLEVLSMAALPLALLFVPIGIAMKEIFVWVNPSPLLGEELLHRLDQRHFFLNIPFFALRTAIYLITWASVAGWLFRWSIRQDQSGDLELTRKLRRLSGGALPAVGLTLTFAAYDWILSLIVEFHSEILPLYYFGGSAVAALGLLIIAAARTTGPGEPGRFMVPEHFRALGMLLLALVAFWAWMAFSQFMLIWAAHLPDDIPFFVDRFRPGWGWLGGFLIVAQFALPFFALLSRDLKEHPGLLAAVSVWVVLAHYFDVYWLVMPALYPQAPRPFFTDLTAVLGIGGLCLAYAVWLLRGRYLVPVNDPYLADSLIYGTRSGP
jgi:hypothetical protein